MSFIGDVKKGVVYTPGWFLANDDENCIRETRQIAQDGAVAVNDTKYVPMGTIYPSNDSNAIGIVYEDVDVTTGDMPGSVVTKGNVYLDRLPVAPTSDAKTALAGFGFKFIDSAPAVTRPY